MVNTERKVLTVNFRSNQVIQIFKIKLFISFSYSLEYFGPHLLCSPDQGDFLIIQKSQTHIIYQDNSLSPRAHLYHPSKYAIASHLTIRSPDYPELEHYHSVTKNWTEGRRNLQYILMYFSRDSQFLPLFYICNRTQFYPQLMNPAKGLYCPASLTVRSRYMSK